MAEYSTASFDTGRYDKSAPVPQLDRSQPDLSASNEMIAFAKGLDQLGQSYGNMKVAQKNQEVRAAQEKRAKEVYARQEKTRKENEAKIKAELLWNKHGGSWNELTEKEQADLTNNVKSQEQGITSEGELQGSGTYKTSTKGVLSEEEKSDKYLKEAYQLKRYDSILVKNQKNWNQVSTNLINDVYSEWEEQRNSPGGSQDFVEYASARLEDFKIQRFERHYQGLDPNVLAKALENRPVDDSLYLSAAAKKQEEFIDELQDKTIQAAIDDNATYKLNTPEGLDALTNSIYLADDGTNRMTVFGRDRVVNQIIDHLDRGVDEATDPDAEVFRTIKAFKGINRKKGRAFFDRRGGIGKRWEDWVKKATKKQNSLRDKKITATNAALTQQIKLAKINANSHEIVGASALNYVNPTQEQIQKAHTSGTTRPLLRIEVLKSALRNLKKSEKTYGYFSKGDKSADFIKLESELEAAIQKENPNHKDYTPGTDELAKATNEFKAKVSDMSYQDIEGLRSELAKTPAPKWEADLRESIMDERETEITQIQNDEKQALSIETSKLNLEEKKKTESSETEKNRIKKELILGKETSLGGKKFHEPRTKKEMKQLLQGLSSNKKLTQSDITKLTDEIKPIIKNLEKRDREIADGKQFANYFKELTTFEETSGGYPSVKDITKLETQINSRTWTDKAKHNQLTSLLAAHKKGKAAYKTARDEIKKENAYSTEMKKRLSPVKTQLQELIGKVATKGMTGQQAKEAFVTLKSEFEEKNKDFIASGEELKNKIDYIEDFDKGLEGILSQRTEVDIAESKKNLVRLSNVNSELRRDKVGNILKEHTEIMTDKKSLLDPQKVSALVSKIRTTSFLEVDKEGNRNVTNLFTPEEVEKYVKDLQVEIINASDPSKVISKQEVLVESSKKIKELEGLSGTARVNKIAEAKDYLIDNLISGDLDISNYRIEKSAVDEIASSGKITTKPAYRAGEEAIRLVFAQKLDNYLKNDRYLPAREGTKLLNELTQAFNKKWNLEEHNLEGANKSEKLAKAYEIANSLTQVYENPKEHPIDADINRRLKEFSMPKRELRKIWFKRRGRTTYDESSETTSDNSTSTPTTGKEQAPSAWEAELDEDLQDAIDAQSSEEDPQSVSNTGPINKYGIPIFGEYDFYGHKMVSHIL